MSLNSLYCPLCAAIAATAFDWRLLCNGPAFLPCFDQVLDEGLNGRFLVRLHDDPASSVAKLLHVVYDLIHSEPANGPFCRNRSREVHAGDPLTPGQHRQLEAELVSREAIIKGVF